jgi:hypothetical protein
MEQRRSAVLLFSHIEPLAQAERVRILMGQLWEYERHGIVPADFFVEE